jgi:hypothetical protein
MVGVVVVVTVGGVLVRVRVRVRGRGRDGGVSWRVLGWWLAIVRRFGRFCWRREGGARVPFSFLGCLLEEGMVGFVLWKLIPPPGTGGHASAFGGLEAVDSRRQPLVTLARRRRIDAPFGFGGQRYLLLPFGLLPPVVHSGVSASVLVGPLSSLFAPLQLQALAAAISQGCRRIGGFVSLDESLAFR